MEFTGSVIVLIPSLSDRERFAAAGGDPRYTEADIHLTLAYLGGTSVKERDVAAGALEVKRVAGRTRAFDAKVNGGAILGDDEAAVALIESFELHDLQKHFAQSTPKSKFPGFIPHITVQYGAENFTDVYHRLPIEVRFTHLGIFSPFGNQSFPLK